MMESREKLTKMMMRRGIHKWMVLFTFFFLFVSFVGVSKIFVGRQSYSCLFLFHLPFYFVSFFFLLGLGIQMIAFCCRANRHRMHKHTQAHTHYYGMSMCFVNMSLCLYVKRCDCPFVHISNQIFCRRLHIYFESSECYFERSNNHIRYFGSRGILTCVLSHTKTEKMKKKNQNLYDFRKHLPLHIIMILKFFEC